MICPRCLKTEVDVHTCNPTEYARRIENERDAAMKALAWALDDGVYYQRLNEAESVLSNHGCGCCSDHGIDVPTEHATIIAKACSMIDALAGVKHED